ncbi:MAG: cobalamin B12-binding domain-containing protein [Ignavibacteriae bacterium]|nr:cobalamin B12-binding domain-containing protein [Ignavibacteriota bacterium]
MDRKIRILIGKVGLDGHDRGAKVIASAFRDAGFEVIYVGLRQTPESIVESAAQEDVDVIGVSILSGAHMTIFPRIKKLMDDKGINDILLFGGGIIPQNDIDELYALGIGKLFTPGATTTETIEYVRTWVSENSKY